MTGSPGDGQLVDRWFAAPVEGAQVELSTIADMRARSEELMAKPGRIGFHSVIICTGGEGLHEVDFAPVVVKPGRVIHVWPGQVHRFRFGRDYDAAMLLFLDEAADLTTPRWPIGPQWFDLSDEEMSLSAEALAVLAHEQVAQRSAESRQRATAGALQLLIVRLGLDVHPETRRTGLPEPYVRLMEQLGDGSGWSRSVTDRAARLGYSQRTLSRACKTATGRSAKEVIDDRIVLEAQRLLVNQTTTVEAVARELSFSEVGNFTKFFRRMRGENPDAWRRRHMAAL